MSKQLKLGTINDLAILLSLRQELTMAKQNLQPYKRYPQIPDYTKYSKLVAVAEERYEMAQKELGMEIISFDFRINEVKFTIVNTGEMFVVRKVLNGLTNKFEWMVM